ncbi:MAG: Asp-tRNA(Asn)/Glu-tRNA(Gln) amidotransferase subunit GatC [bacterium]
MKEKISKTQIEYIAKLAGLRIDDKEIDSFRKDLKSILEYVSSLQELNTDGIESLSGLKTDKNKWHDDKPGDGDNIKTILKNAPEKEKNYFKVPKIKES